MRCRPHARFRTSWGQLDECNTLCHVLGRIPRAAERGTLIGSLAKLCASGRGRSALWPQVGLEGSELSRRTRRTLHGPPWPCHPTTVRARRRRYAPRGPDGDTPDAQRHNQQTALHCVDMATQRRRPSCDAECMDRSSTPLDLGNTIRWRQHARRTIPTERGAAGRGQAEDCWAGHRVLSQTIATSCMHTLTTTTWRHISSTNWTQMTNRPPETTGAGCTRSCRNLNSAGPTRAAIPNDPPLRPTTR